MGCKHKGDQVGIIFHLCCGGREERLAIYACKSEQQPLEFCTETEPEGLQPVEIAGKPREVVEVADCRHCPFKELDGAQPKENNAVRMWRENRQRKKIERTKQAKKEKPPEVVVHLSTARVESDPDIVHPMVGDAYAKRLPAAPIIDKPAPVLNSSARAHAALRAKRRPPADAPGVVVMECDYHGYGDAILAAWVAEGTKGLNDRLLLRATGAKADLLRAMGQELTIAPQTSNISGMYLPGITGIGMPPAVVVRARQLGFSAEPKRPSFTYDSDCEAWAESRRDIHRSEVMLFPQCADSKRTWHVAHWMNLYRLLKREGLRVIVSGLPDGIFDKLPEWLPMTWTQAASAMKRTRLVINNDSGPAHLAGTLDVPTIVLHGLTSDAMYAHCPSVTSLSVSRQRFPCVGCWLGWGFTKERCGKTCDALQSIDARDVFGTAMEILNTERAVRLFRSMPLWNNDRRDLLKEHVYRRKYELVERLGLSSICEIGVRAGYSAFMFLQAGATLVYGIDSEVLTDGDGQGTSYEPGAIDHAKQLCGDKLILVKQDSQQLHQLPQWFDLVHIDGDHSQSGTEHDIELAATSTDLILIDDYWTWVGTGQAARNYAKREGWELIVLDDKQALLVRPNVAEGVRKITEWL